MLHFRQIMALLVSLTLIVSSAVPAYSSCACDHPASESECCSKRAVPPRAPEPTDSCCSGGAEAAHHECARIQITGASKSLQAPPCQQDQFFGEPVAPTGTGPRVERAEELPILVGAPPVPVLHSSEARGGMRSRPPPRAFSPLPLFLLHGSFLS